MKKLRIALAGNANVGKSTIFNGLTGLHQHMGNWPGKTVEKAEGMLVSRGRQIEVTDLPGVYSLTPFSAEEQITREYICTERPDVVINVVDASVLERNLFLTLSLLRLGAPTVVALNMVDVAERKGIRVDASKLSRLLGAPVVPVVATRGIGLSRLIEEAAKAADHSRRCMHKRKKPDSAKAIRQKYAEAERIARACTVITEARPSLGEKLDSLLMHKYSGYLFLIAAALLVFFSIFSFGNALSGFLLQLFHSAKSALRQSFGEGLLPFLLVEGVLEGIAAALSVAIPYLIPFFIALAILEDSGYLARMAFLMDSAMHKIGLHGKAFIPMMLGYGCTVPACLSCRIMETDRERFLAAFLVTLIPCSARSVIIMGLVAAFVGIEWALALYLLNIIIIAILGRIAFKTFPGEPMGLIMEMPTYKMPVLRNVLRSAWRKTKSFIFMALPIIVLSTLAIKSIEYAGWLAPISQLLSPITVGLLGLPAIAGITLIFGILRKELALIMLAALLGTENFAAALTPVQMLTFAIVSMHYIPCAATIAALNKEFGWKKALAITIFEIVFALLLGGIAARVLPMFFG